MWLVRRRATATIVLQKNWGLSPVLYRDQLGSKGKKKPARGRLFDGAGSAYSRLPLVKPRIDSRLLKMLYTLRYRPSVALM